MTTMTLVEHSEEKSIFRTSCIQDLLLGTQDATVTVTVFLTGGTTAAEGARAVGRAGGAALEEGRGRGWGGRGGGRRGDGEGGGGGW